LLLRCRTGKGSGVIGSGIADTGLAGVAGVKRTGISVKNADLIRTGVAGLIRTGLAGVRTGIAGRTGVAGLIRTGLAGVVTRTGLAGVRTGITGGTGVAGVGSGTADNIVTTACWLRRPRQITATSKAHIKVKFVMLAHFFFSLHLKIVAPVTALWIHRDCLAPPLIS